MQFNTPDEESISLHNLLYVSKFCGIERKADFVADYLNGALTPIGRYGNTTDDILFKREDVLTCSRASRIDQRSRACTIIDASSILNCCSTVIPSLAKLGYLRFAETGSLKRERITRESIESFSTQWESIRAIYRDLNVPSMRIQNIADKNKFFRLAVPSFYRDVSFSSFVKKTDVARLRDLVQDDIQKFGRQHAAPKRVD